MSTDTQILNTILAALNFYCEEGMGEPMNRSDAIHDIATDGGHETSLDEEMIDELIKDLNTGEIVFIGCQELSRVSNQLVNEVIGADVFLEPLGIGTPEDIASEEKRVEDAQETLNRVVADLQRWAGNPVKEISDSGAEQ
ncbi:hypothetical protein [Neptuniibacter halophilus]|uniref:hypothetical protein n=1 Tax=Neptuniibacter halophilus TaxID=651666 RepID=UPI0025735DA7|nr:hypothetical protein [Neptuniibacter halophilus]